MERVLGLSITSKDLRWVLVDDVTGAGAAVDRGVLDIADVKAGDADELFAGLVSSADLYAVGLTWSPGAEAVAAQVHQTLGAVAGAAPVVVVNHVEAVEVLAAGIAAIAGYDFLMVCSVEPDATAVATVSSRGVAGERIDHTKSVALIDRVCAVVARSRPSPDAIFVLGCADADALAAALREVTTRPVITATQAEFALPRGAALAAARRSAMPAAPVDKPAPRAGVAASVLAAAAVLAVVAVSLVAVARVTSESPERPRTGTAAEHTIRPATPPPVRHTIAAPAAPAPEVAAPPGVPAPEAVAPPAPGAAAPPASNDAPPAAVPPPVYEPPVAEPVYVPPAAPPPPPRLRDRIADKFPVFNRFR